MLSDRLTRIAAHRRALHMIPELGYDLIETQAYVLKVLSRTRAKVEALSPSGALAYFDMGRSETVALRADMDALPIEEKTGLSFASVHPGCMHACGHDAHTAMLLALCEELDCLKTPRNVLAVFQPAEEAGNGAASVIASGALERYGVKEIFACHVEPSLPAGTVASRAGALMAMASEVHVLVKGKSAHIAHADEGIDALRAGAEFLLASTDLVQRNYTDVRHLFGFGRLISGTANNIVSDETRMDGALRAFDEGVFARIKEDVLSVAREVSARTGAQINVDIPGGYPPLINDKGCFCRLREKAQGLPFRELESPKLTTEDFACYLKHVPGLMFLLGIESPHPLHSPFLSFGEDCLLNGAEMFMRLI